MNKRVTIAPDGSRDVDVQSLFYDQFEMVRRIARMMTTDICEHGIRAMSCPACQHKCCESPAVTVAKLYAAQNLIAGLEAERDRLRHLLRSIYNDLPIRRDWLDPSLERSIHDELEVPDAN